jgi:hypothetical protein
MAMRWIIVLICAAAFAADQTGSLPYAGAKIDRAATEQAKAAAAGQPELEITVYKTADSFDKVCELFKKTGREYKVLGASGRKLPNGHELKNAIFILDNGADLVGSRLWVKIQRPYIGPYGLTHNGAGEIQDITAIVLTRKR